MNGDQRALERGREQRVGVGAGEHDREMAGRLSSAVTIATASSRPGACAGRSTIRSRVGCVGLVHPPAQEHRRQPVGDLHRPLGERRLRVAHQLQRAEPAEPAVGIEGAHDVGRAQPFALEQLADQPRLGSLRVTSS